MSHELPEVDTVQSLIQARIEKLARLGLTVQACEQAVRAVRGARRDEAAVLPELRR